MTRSCKGYPQNFELHVLEFLLLYSHLFSLRANDQRNIERKAGRVFKGFSEDTLEFETTYKYDPQCNQYALRSWLHAHAVLNLRLQYRYCFYSYSHSQTHQLELALIPCGLLCGLILLLPPPLQVFFLRESKETQGASVVCAMATIIVIIVCVFECCISNFHS